MRSRSLTQTLALAFAGTTLAVFALVGSYVYMALAHEVSTQDDQDIVLAARHMRRLTQELANVSELTQHQERLESQVLGNGALSAEVIDSSGRILLQHNLSNVALGIAWPAVQLDSSEQITAASIAALTASDGTPFRRVATEAQLAHAGSSVTDSRDA